MGTNFPGTFSGAGVAASGMHGPRSPGSWRGKEFKIRIGWKAEKKNQNLEENFLWQVLATRLRNGMDFQGSDLWSIGNLLRMFGPQFFEYEKKNARGI